MKSKTVLVIGQRDVLHIGLVEILRASQYKSVRDLSIDDELPKTVGRTAVDLIAIIEPREMEGRVKAMVSSLRRRFASVCIVVLSQDGEPRWTREDGIDACLPPTITSRALLLALELLLCREAKITNLLAPPSKETRGAAPTSYSEPPPTETIFSMRDQTVLSSREQEILRWLARGESNKAIARGLAIEEATVKAHVRTVLRKTGASNRTQAALLANALLASAQGNSPQHTH